FPLLAAGLWLLAKWQSGGDAVNFLTSNTALGALAAAAAAFVITWLSRFVILLLNAPVELDRQNKAKIEQLEKKLIPSIDVLFGIGEPYEHTKYHDTS